MIEVVLGPGYDDELFSRLAAEVTALGGSMEDKAWALGGSQEMIVFHIALPGGVLEAVVETHVGLFLRGECSLVELLARRVRPNWSLQRADSPSAELAR